MILLDIGHKSLEVLLKILHFLRITDARNRFSITNMLVVNAVVWFNLVMYGIVFGHGVADASQLITVLVSLMGGSINYGVKKWKEEQK
jgi:hypothetical protein